MTDQEDLLKILLKTNSEAHNPVDEELLKQILSLEIQYPLEDDRKRCQEGIKQVLSTKPLAKWCKKDEDNNNKD